MSFSLARSYALTDGAPLYSPRLAHLSLSPWSNPPALLHILVQPCVHRCARVHTVTSGILRKPRDIAITRTLAGLYKPSERASERARTAAGVQGLTRNQGVSRTRQFICSRSIIPPKSDEQPLVYSLAQVTASAWSAEVGGERGFVGANSRSIYSSLSLSLIPLINAGSSIKYFPTARRFLLKIRASRAK